MRLPRRALHRRVLLLISLLAFPFWRATAQTRVIPARITQAVDEKNLVVLKGNVHPLARPEFDQGIVGDAQPLNRMLLLLRRSEDQEAALRQLLDDQQSKSSPNYHAWLTPQQFGKQFGPADADIQAVTQWLTSQGFTGINVGPGRQVIEFSGMASEVRHAFRTEIHRFVIDGKEYSANTADPQIPSALTPVIAGIVSLHNFPRKSYARILGQFRRTIGKPGLEPLFTFPVPSNGRNFYGLGPGDFAAIYNTKPLITGSPAIDGTGQTIAIVGETNFNVQDVQQFRKMFGLPANFDATNVILNGEDPGITSRGEEGEADLDVEWSGAVAPGAAIKFVLSASTPASAGIDLSALYIVEHNLAGVMSESYGECEQALGTAGNAFYNSLWEQAAAQGITVVISSGDGGSAGCDNFGTQQTAKQGLAVTGFASTPFNVSVGGTDFDQVNNWAAYWNSTNDATGTSAKSYIPEIPWSENCAQIGLTGCGASAPNGSVNIVAGSGGPSGVYGKPNWQVGVAGMPNDNHRDQPDISLFASPGFNGTGYVYCQSDQTISGATACDITNASNGTLDFGIVGGTSASAPAFAGIMALVNQRQSSAQVPAPRQGNANYVLYALAKKSGASCMSSATEVAGCIFNDVTKGNSALPTGMPGVGTNSVPCQGGSLNCSVSSAGSNGVLVDPSHTTTEAWTATAGYDMTTGLGTVNANNLATNWGSTSTIPTTTTLTLSPTTGITHGTAENVTVGITVKPNIGTAVPAGDVALIATFPDGTTQGFDQFTLANGAVTSAKAQSLPGGTYNVSAHYAGDGTNAPSDSAPVQVTVATEPSQTFIVIPTYDSQGNLLNGNATSVTYGSNYIFRMYVTDKNGVASTTGPPSPTCYLENVLTCPSGTVTLTNNGALLGTGGGGPGIYNLNNFGYTRDLAPALTGGTYGLVAKYSGDSSYQPSTSATDTFTVTPAPGTQLIFTNNSRIALIGSSATLSLLGIPNVPSGATATGSVSLFEGSTQIAGPVPVACYYCAPGEPVDFTASLQASFSTSGNHSITAQYSGDADYAAATSTPLTVDAVYPTTITQTVSATTINYGQSMTITASVMTSPKSPPMTGAFTFNSSYTQIPGPVTGTLTTDSSGNQILTAAVTTTPQSSEAIQAFYSGDVNYASVSTTSNFVTVNLPGFSMAPNPVYLTITAGQTGSQQLTITPANNLVSTVNFSCNPYATIGITCSFSPTSVNLTNTTSGTATVTLATLPPSATSAAAFPASPGVKWPRWPGGRGWPVGLDLVCLLALLLSFLPRQSRTKRLAFGLVAASSLLHVFGCGGGSPGGGGGGGGPVPTLVAITVSATKVSAGTSPSVTLSANVTSTKTITGTITFWEKGNDGALTPPLTIVANSASTQVALPFVGTHQIYAQYSGDSQNQGSQSSTLNVVATGTAYMGVQATNGPVSQSSTIWVTIQ